MRNSEGIVITKKFKNKGKKRNLQGGKFNLMERKHAVEVIMKDPAVNPCCPHGPTLLFSKKVKEKTKKFYACAALRERKFCPFYIDEGASTKCSDYWQRKIVDFHKTINHKKMFALANKTRLLKPSERLFCSTCASFLLKYDAKHKNHNIIKGVSDQQFLNPTQMLPPSEIDKSEAQYWFSTSAVDCIIQILKSLNYRNVICIGAPRIHEHLRTNSENMTSILLDFDKRFHNFFGPSEFCWYNLFNHYFYFEEAKTVFFDFLQKDSGDNMVIITDPPFGGRTEPIAFTFRTINETYQKLNGREENIPVFWIYPYFMELHIRHSDPRFTMLDYKVDYENHPVFGIGPKARKLGSPVRIFTTVNPSLIKLPVTDGYIYCKKCNKWVSEENIHCDICKACTSKDGRTYVHCYKCKRCVKPTWVHCDKCMKCKLLIHYCDGTKNVKSVKKRLGRAMKRKVASVTISKDIKKKRTKNDVDVNKDQQDSRTIKFK